MLPLFEGATDWWSCFLARETHADGSYTLHDSNLHNPDAEHEGQLVADPQIGLTLLLRAAQAHVDIAQGLGLPTPTRALEIITHLVAPNSITEEVPLPPTSTNFSRLDNWRFTGDYHMGTATDVDACVAECAADARCACFTFCASPATPTCPEGPSCWKYVSASGGHVGEAFTSGCREGPPPPPVNVSAWVGYSGASIAQSDTFSFYPIYPAESIGGLTHLTDADRLIAQASAAIYSDLPGGSRRPLDIYVNAILSLAGAGTLPPSPLSFTPAEIVSGLEVYISKNIGRNQLLSAPGGGVENTGVARAVTEMLLGSGVLVPTVDPVTAAVSQAQWFARLFPMWPPTAGNISDGASYSGLLAKGGCAYSASYKGGAVVSPLSVSALYPSGTGSSAGVGNCTMLLPERWTPTSTTVECGGISPPLVWLTVVEGGGLRTPAMSILAPTGVSCTVSNQMSVHTVS